MSERLKNPRQVFTASHDILRTLGLENANDEMQTAIENRIQQAITEAVTNTRTPLDIPVVSILSTAPRTREQQLEHELQEALERFKTIESLLTDTNYTPDPGSKLSEAFAWVQTGRFECERVLSKV